MELERPVLTEASRIANFTNEAGLDGTVRYLRNIMGLWLLQECVREWSADLPPLLRAAADLPPLRSVIDAADRAFLAPERMPDRIREACRATGQPVPATPPEITRCILDSLALAHRRAVEDAQRLADQSVDAVHIVGGGVRNTLLCQLTADACGLPVVAGQAEAAALGNVLVQARALGMVGDRGEMRALVAGTQPLARYERRGIAGLGMRRLRGLGLGRGDVLPGTNPLCGAPAKPHRSRSICAHRNRAGTVGRLSRSDRLALL